MTRGDAGTSGSSQIELSADSLPTVYLVSDDPLRVAQLRASIGAMGFRIATFQSVSDYRASLGPSCFGCLLLDGESCVPALNVLAEVAADQPAPPVVFLTDDQDVRVVVQAMRNGAADFLFRRTSAESDLWEALQNGIAWHRTSREAAERRYQRRKRLEQLTAVEQEIVQRLISGQNNRQIAEEMRLSRSAVEGRRSRLMRKLGIAHLPGLVKFVVSAETENM